MLGGAAGRDVGHFGRRQRENLISELSVGRLQCRDALRYLAVFGGELLLIGGKLVDCLAYNDEIKRYRLELLGQFRRTCVCGG